MKVYFYGRRMEPPSKELARAFGADVPPRPLKGGQGTAYIAGNIVLKPSERDLVSDWMAEVFSRLDDSPWVRFARPLKSRHGTWTDDGYVAWEFLEGEHKRGQYGQKLLASREFHRLLAGIDRPGFLTSPRSSWSAADQVSAGERMFDYDEEFVRLYEQIAPRLKPLTGCSQLIHGDLSGNFLLHPKLPPAIIDFSPAWAPQGMAEGIMLADAIVYESATIADLESWFSVPEVEQFAWRGVIRRISEQAEHIKFLGKDKSQALRDARAFQKAIDVLNAVFPLHDPTVGKTFAYLWQQF